MEILRSLRYLATAKPFVDEEIYDYKPKKKVYRGHQYNRNIVTRARSNDRLNDFPEKTVETTPDEAYLKSTELSDDTKKPETQETPDNMKKETPTSSSSDQVVNDSKKKINDAAKELIEKASKITKAATQETAPADIATIKEEVAKLTEKVNVEWTKIKETSKESNEGVTIQISGPIESSKEVIEKSAKTVSDAIPSTEDFIESDVEAPEDTNIGINVRSD